MSSISSKEMLLGSVISGEAGKLGKKMNFWGVDGKEDETLWETSGSLDLENVLSTIDQKKDLPQSYELELLYCMAWEFVWGKKPPESVATLRSEIIRKAYEGEVLLKLEEEWLKLILVDTDMF